MKITDVITHPMKVELEQASWTAHEISGDATLTLFEVRTDGYLYVLQEEPPPELHDKVREAASLCPTAAIELDD